MPLILESLVTTRNADGTINIAPQGPVVLAPGERYLFRPYQESQTFANLARDRRGVLHVTDDVLLLAQAAVGVPERMPELRPAEKIEGAILTSACRWHEFEITAVHTQKPRSEMEAVVVHGGTQREFFGWNRAQAAVIEAAILATRLPFLCPAQIRAEFQRLAIIVDKTGGELEHAAWQFLFEHIEQRLPRGS
jgi:hypothetical protein